MTTNRRHRLQVVGRHRRIDADHCVYCGERPRDLDHFVPISRAAELTEAGIEFTKLVVPACNECNLLASDKIFQTLKDKRQFIQAKLAKRYKSLLDSPEWTDRELDQLGFYLKERIVNDLVRKRVIQRRIAWVNMPDIDGIPILEDKE